MTADDTPQAILAEVAGLAASRGWTGVSAFAGAIPAPGAGDIEILAPAGTDPGALAAWISAQAGDAGGRGGGTTLPAALPAAPLRVSVLEPLAAGPERALPPNRSVVALRCGQLLLADGAAAAAAVLGRPAGTRYLVLTGAEDIASAEDLAAIERGLWRVLLAPDGQEWRGQDIAAHGCLLWSDREVAGALRGRVGKDVAELREWLAGPVTVPPELHRDRAACAVSLALTALGEEQAGSGRAAESAAGERDATRLAGLAAEVRGLHARLLDRLSADAGVTERQVLSSLRVLEVDLAKAAAAKPALPPDHAERRVAEWTVRSDLAIGQRRLAAAEQAGQLLDRIDWDFVNQVAPHPKGGRYPAALIDPIRAQAVSMPAAGGSPAAGAAGSGRARSRPQGLGSVSPGTLITAGAGAVTLGLLGVPLLPVAGAAAIGVLGGSAFEATRRADESRMRARSAAEAIENAEAAILRALRAADAARSATVSAQFTLLEQALGEAAERARRSALTAAAPDTGGEELRARLTGLASRVMPRQDATVRSEYS